MASQSLRSEQMTGKAEQQAQNLSREEPVYALRACSGFSAVGQKQADFLSVFAFLKAHSRCYVTEKR
jgi:hypothetical protein